MEELDTVEKTSANCKRFISPKIFNLNDINLPENLPENAAEEDSQVDGAVSSHPTTVVDGVPLKHLESECGRGSWTARGGGGENRPFQLFQHVANKGMPTFFARYHPSQTKKGNSVSCNSVEPENGSSSSRRSVSSGSKLKDRLGTSSSERPSVRQRSNHSWVDSRTQRRESNVRRRSRSRDRDPDLHRRDLRRNLAQREDRDLHRHLHRPENGDLRRREERNLRRKKSPSKKRERRSRRRSCERSRDHSRKRSPTASQQSRRRRSSDNTCRERNHSAFSSPSTSSRKQRHSSSSQKQSSSGSCRSRKERPFVSSCEMAEPISDSAKPARPRPRPQTLSSETLKLTEDVLVQFPSMVGGGSNRRHVNLESVTSHIEDRLLGRVRRVPGTAHPKESTPPSGVASKEPAESLSSNSQLLAESVGQSSVSVGQFADSVGQSAESLPKQAVPASSDSQHSLADLLFDRSEASIRQAKKPAFVLKIKSKEARLEEKFLLRTKSHLTEDELQTCVHLVNDAVFLTEIPHFQRQFERMKTDCQRALQYLEHFLEEATSLVERSFLQQGIGMLFLCHVQLEKGHSEVAPSDRQMALLHSEVAPPTLLGKDCGCDLAVPVEDAKTLQILEETVLSHLLNEESIVGCKASVVGKDGVVAVCEQQVARTSFYYPQGAPVLLCEEHGESLLTHRMCPCGHFPSTEEGRGGGNGRGFCRFGHFFHSECFRECPHNPCLGQTENGGAMVLPLTGVIVDDTV